MIGSVHVADLGVPASFSALARPPKPGKVKGLRQANTALAAPLSGSLLASPQLGRVGLVAFWDDDDALDAFLAADGLGQRLASGWHVRLEALRMHGTWPGVPDDLPSDRHVEHEGPAVVLTLGRLRMSQVVRFLRTSAKAEGAVVEAPGLLWATGLARPPFVATCSIWESSKALSTYAYGQRRPAHADAIAQDEMKPFHHQEAFIRFRPYDAQGHLDNRNPLADQLLTLAAR